MTTIGSMNHLRLTVRDIPEAERFYQPLLSFLGYELMQRDAERLAWAMNGPAGRMQWFILSAAAEEFRDRKHDLRAPGFHHFAFNADSRMQVDGFHRLLVDRNAEILYPPAEYDYEPGYYAVFFLDPDGFKLEVAHVPQAPAPTDATGRLAGKVAIVTGAAGGIGKVVSARFAAEGARVLCVDTHAAALIETVAEITSSGGTAQACEADVSEAPDVAEAALGAFGAIDVLHANAAVQVLGSLEQTTPGQWDDMYATNLRAVAAGIAAVVPHLRQRGGGSIIITSSLLGITGDPDLPMYGATKGALRALCRSAAAAYGPEGIRCNTICPGDVDTPMVQEFFRFQADPVAARAQIESRYPLRRLAAPADVASAAVFLASDESAYITGIDLIVDGGLLARIY